MDRRSASRRIAGARDRGSVQSIERAIGVLRVIARAARAGCRLTDVAQACHLSKSTTHRLLAALVADGLVEQDRDDRLFRTGVELLRLGLATSERFDVVEIARPALVHLAERSGDTVFLSVPARNQALCVDRQLGAIPAPPRMIEVGDTRPLGIGSGALALLATRSDDEVEAAIAASREERAQFAAFDVATIRSLVAATRQNGYALIDGQIVAGLSGIGIPVRDPAGRAVAALSVTALNPRLQGSRRQQILGLLREQVRQIERRLVALR